jgi:hypothetical protein
METVLVGGPPVFKIAFRVLARKDLSRICLASRRKLGLKS